MKAHIKHHKGVDHILFVIFSRLFPNKSETKISEGLHTAMYTPTSTLNLDLVQNYPH